MKTIKTPYKYTTPPCSVVYMGSRYVLAAEGAEAEEDTEEATPKKGTRSARIAIDECKGEAVVFDLEFLVESYSEPAIPGLDVSGGRNFRIKHITKLTQLPPTTLNRIETSDDGSVARRIERLLRTKPFVPLYFVEAHGGWVWGKKNGAENVQMIQALLNYMRSRKTMLYTYCNNQMKYGDRVGLI